MLHVSLHRGVVELSTDETLRIEHSVLRVSCHLILCCISNKAFGISKSGVRLGDCRTFNLDVYQLLFRLHLGNDPLPRMQFVVYLLKGQVRPVYGISSPLAIPSDILLA